MHGLLDERYCRDPGSGHACMGQGLHDSYANVSRNGPDAALESRQPAEDNAGCLPVPAATALLQ